MDFLTPALMTETETWPKRDFVYRKSAWFQASAAM